MSSDNKSSEYKSIHYVSIDTPDIYQRLNSYFKLENNIKVISDQIRQYSIPIREISIRVFYDDYKTVQATINILDDKSLECHRSFGENINYLRFWKEIYTHLTGKEIEMKTGLFSNNRIDIELLKFTLEELEKQIVSKSTLGNLEYVAFCCSDIECIKLIEQKFKNLLFYGNQEDYIYNCSVGYITRKCFDYLETKF